MKYFLIFFVISGLFFSSCSHDEILNTTDSPVSVDEGVIANSLSDSDREKYLVEFASILSKVVYERKDVREFLKNEALKQFDRNYNVLYYLVNDQMIGNESFEDILITYSSKVAINEIETNIPLLNILIPEIAFFDIYPKDLDINDNEIPVAVSKKSVTTLYFNGKEEVNLNKGEVPDFHVFVVNENEQVIIPKGTLKSTAAKSIEFISPNFDGSLVQLEDSMLKASTTSSISVGNKSIEAYSYFYKNDGSINQMGFQRDYIYYGITPQNRSGSYNNAISEYINYIEVDPVIFTNISDDINGDSGDPYVSNSKIENKTNTLSSEQLYDKMWTKGAFKFRFEIIKSNVGISLSIPISVKPKDLWNFDISHSRTHSTWFRKSKHTYVINTSAMTPKKVFLADLNMVVNMGKWNIQEESLTRMVRVFEDDLEVEKSVSQTFENTYVLNSSFSGSYKLNIGLDGIGSVEPSATASVSSQNTTKSSTTVTVKYKEGSDHLGDHLIYFYDPIILNIDYSQSPITYSGLSGHPFRNYPDTF